MPRRSPFAAYNTSSDVYLYGLSINISYSICGIVFGSRLGGISAIKTGQSSATDMNVLGKLVVVIFYHKNAISSVYTLDIAYFVQLLFCCAVVVNTHYVTFGIAE